MVLVIHSRRRNVMRWSGEPRWILQPLFCSFGERSREIRIVSAGYVPVHTVHGVRSNGRIVAGLVGARANSAVRIVLVESDAFLEIHIQGYVTCCSSIAIHFIAVRSPGSHTGLRFAATYIARTVNPCLTESPRSRGQIGVTDMSLAPPAMHNA